MSPSYNFKKSMEYILSQVKEYYIDFDAEQEKTIWQAFEYAKDTFKGKTRASGDPYFAHTLETAKILLTIQPDRETLMATILYNTLRESSRSPEEIEELFGPRIRFLCESMRQIGKIKFLHEKENSAEQIENIQQLLFLVSKDIRVLFVKLAARIHNLKTLRYISPEKAIIVAKEAEKILAPVAERLGLFSFKTQIEDLCLAYLHPKVFRQIENGVKVIKKENANFFAEAKKEIREIFEQKGLSDIEIQGRQKNYASIYSKMKRKNLTSVHDVYDIIGIRILVPSEEDCYRALGILYSLWKPIPNCYKDYISLPKPNGYQSLHTTILGLANSQYPTEVQIRTFKMHNDSEFGPASHWAYKKIKHSNFDEDYLKRMNWLPSYQPSSTSEEHFTALAKNISLKSIYVFSTQGKIITLPAESTPIDFAYEIDPEIGNGCIGTRINGIIKPLNYPLKNGDIVEILSKKGRTPNPSWFDFAKSQKAQTHIREFMEKAKESGQAMNSVLDTIFLKPRKHKKIVSEKSTLSPLVEERLGKYNVIIGGEKNLPHKIANCCSIRENIVAYKSRGLMFTLHSTDCPQLEKLSSERIFEAHFLFERRFRVKVVDRVGLAKDYATIMADNNLGIVQESSMKTSTDKNGNRIVSWSFMLEGHSLQEIERAIRQFRETPNILELEALTDKPVSERIKS